MDSKTQESRQNYNKKAKDYDNTFDGRFTLPYNLMLCESASLKKGDAVLDVACGNGRLLRMLSSKVEISAFGMDVSEEMVRIAGETNPDMNFSVGNASEMPFDDKTFDLVTVCCAFHHFTDPTSFMKEASRVLKPGGRLMIADPVLPLLIRHVGNLVIPLLSMGDVKMYGMKELAMFFESAGFGQIAARRNGARGIVEGVRI